MSWLDPDGGRCCGALVPLLYANLWGAVVIEPRETPRETAANLSLIQNLLSYFVHALQNFFKSVEEPQPRHQPPKTLRVRDGRTLAVNFDTLDKLVYLTRQSLSGSQIKAGSLSAIYDSRQVGCFSPEHSTFSSEDISRINTFSISINSV